MSENDGSESGGNSPIKMVILVVVLVALAGAGWYSVNKSKSLQAEGLPPVDPNAPKREAPAFDMSSDKMMKVIMNSKKKAAEAAAGEAAPAEGAAPAPAPAEAAPAEAAPAEAAPAPAN